MSMETIERARFFLEADLPAAQLLPIASGVAAVYTTRSPHKATPNEDAAVLITCGPDSAVLAVADGFRRPARR